MFKKKSIMKFWMWNMLSAFKQNHLVNVGMRTDEQFYNNLCTSTCKNA